MNVTESTPDASAEASTDAAAEASEVALDATVESSEASPTATPQPRPKPAKPTAPKPRPPSGTVPSPAAIAAHIHHPVRVPVVADVSEAEFAQAATFGTVVDDTVHVTDGDTTREVGPASGDDPFKAYVRGYFEIRTAVERFHARLSTAELAPKDIDDALASLSAQLETPAVVGDLAALRERYAKVAAEAQQVRARITEERRAARAEAMAARTAIVERAEAIAATPVESIHWKNDTAMMRALLDEWKEAQRSHARVAKDAEKSLWKRFTTARSAFEKARKHHFAELDRVNADVATRKEQLAVQAERLAESTDWDRTARAFRDLMGEWKRAGRGRRSVDDALWRRFQAAQDSFFETRRAAADAEDDALSGNVAAKEAAVADAESLLPITDLNAAKQALRAAQDRFEAAGRVPRGDVARLNARMGAVEKAVRDADDSAWNSRNPELEARASGAAAQLTAAIDSLRAEIAQARAAKDSRRAKDLEEALAAREAWLAQIQGVVS